MKWVADPKDGKPSVSLTILAVSFGLLVVAGGLEVFEVTKSTGPFMELTLSSIALYFGRRFSFGGKSFSDEGGPAKDVEEKIEEINKE